MFYLSNFVFRSKEIIIITVFTELSLQFISTRCRQRRSLGRCRSNRFKKFIWFPFMVCAKRKDCCHWSSRKKTIECCISYDILLIIIYHFDMKWIIWVLDYSSIRRMHTTREKEKKNSSKSKRSKFFLQFHNKKNHLQK